MQLFVQLKRFGDAIEVKRSARDQMLEVPTEQLTEQERVQIARWVLTRGPVTDEDLECVEGWAESLEEHASEQLIFSAMVQSMRGDTDGAVERIDRVLNSEDPASGAYDLEDLRGARRAILDQTGSTPGTASPPSSDRSRR